MVVRVYLREKELGNEVRLLMGCGREVFAVGIGTITSQSVFGSDLKAFLISHRIAVGIAVFKGEKRLFLGLERFWQIQE